MSLLSIAHAIQSIGFLTALRESALVYPIVMTIHLSCIAIFGGMILMTDMRLLGLALMDYSITDVVSALRPWKRLGGTIMICMGLLLGTSEAEKYSGNPFFWWKMAFLGCVAVHALIFRPLVYNQTGELDKAPTIPGRAKLAGALSLTLWFGVLTMGRLIGYYEPKQPPPTPAAQAAVVVVHDSAPLR